MLLWFLGIGLFVKTDKKCFSQRLCKASKTYQLGMIVGWNGWIENCRDACINFVEVAWVNYMFDENKWMRKVKGCLNEFSVIFFLPVTKCYYNFSSTDKNSKSTIRYIGAMNYCNFLFVHTYIIVRRLVGLNWIELS